MSLPNTFIIGSQKSSSTFVQFVLGYHPDCFVEKTENRFFEDPDYDRHDLSRLEACFSNAGQQSIRVLKRPTYFTRPITAKRIKRHIPNAKLILSLRHPVERAIAAYFHYMRYRLIDYTEINAGLRRIFADVNRGISTVGTDILDYGLYHKYPSFWSDVFPKEQMFVFVANELTKSDGGRLPQLFDFLEIDAIEIPESTSKERNSGVYSPLGMRLIRAANCVKHKLSDDGKLIQHRPTAHFSTPIWFPLQKAALTIERRNKLRPMIDPVLRQELTLFYQDDMNKLETDYGISFN